MSKITNRIVGPEVVESMRKLAERPTIPQECHKVLLEYDFAVIGYKAKEKALRLAYPTQCGLDWLADTDSGGKLGAAWHREWHFEQRAHFAESQLDTNKDENAK